MSWNYRVIHRKDQATSNEDVYAIHEVYYKGDKPRAMTENPVSPIGENIEELCEDLKCYMAALDKPILEADMFKKET